jgi:hypothetical protein
MAYEVLDLIQHSISKKVGVDEFTEALAQKVDMTALRSALDQKLNYSEMENIRRGLEKVTGELQTKIGFRDME